ncbi:hypothetical protein [Hoeflea sp.]|uniref:hypothetical protein n=1 Tax=Hoeflea sp. TaxID=1940281 RepID=UPI003B524C8E
MSNDAGSLPEFNERSINVDTLARFERPIGQLVLNFGLLERALDFWLVELFPIACEAGLVEKKAYQLGHKIEQARTCLRGLATMNAIRNDTMATLDLLERANTIRNAVVHGTITHSAAEEDPLLFLGRWKQLPSESVPTHSDHCVALSTVVGAVSVTADLIGQMHKLFEQILDLIEENDA